MLGLLKKVFFREAGSSASLSSSAVPVPVAGGAFAPLPESVRPRRTASATMSVNEALRPSSNGAPTLSLSLSSICALLPPELIALATSPVPQHARIEVGLETVTEQLARGAVRIPFGKVRIGAPPGLFTRNEEADERLIDLPLPDILAQVKPARRMHQKRIVVAGDIPSIFGADGAAGPEAVDPEPAPAPVEEAMPESEEATVAPTPALKFVLKEELAPEPEPEIAAEPEPAPMIEAASLHLETAWVALPEEPQVAEEPEIGTPAPVTLPRLSPQAAVEAAMSIDGVTGALCATSDGLLIAGQMPGDVSLRTMAALLPGVLTRIGQYTATVQLGVLDAVQLTVAGARLEARRVAGVSLAVLCQPGAEVDAKAITHIASRMGPASA